VANICVLHTAGSAALRWWRVVVPVDTISALNEFDYRAALRQITFLYRGLLTTVDMLELT
jgi:nicotinamidase-related amidase